MTTTPPEQPAERPSEPADRVAAAALAVPGVASLHSGSFGEVGTYLAGRRVAGVRLGPDSAEVHVTVTMGSDVLAVGRQVADAVEPVAGTSVQVVVEDVVPAAAAPSAPATPATPATPGEPTA